MMMDSGGSSPHSCVFCPLVAEEGKASNIWKSRENWAALKALLSAVGERLSQSGSWGHRKEPDTWLLGIFKAYSLDDRALTYDKVSYKNSNDCWFTSTTYRMPGSTPFTWIISFNLRNNPGSWCIYYPFFIDEESEVPIAGIISSKMRRSLTDAVSTKAS